MLPKPEVIDEWKLKTSRLNGYFFSIIIAILFKLVSLKTHCQTETQKEWSRFLTVGPFKDCKSDNVSYSSLQYCTTGVKAYGGIDDLWNWPRASFRLWINLISFNYFLTLHIHPHAYIHIYNVNTQSVVGFAVICLPSLPIILSLYPFQKAGKGLK